MSFSSGLQLIEPTFLYNLLNQETIYPCLSDPVFMLLLDVRDRNDYNEGHVITARLVHRDAAGEYIIPYDADIECKTHVIVYDGCTESLKNPNSNAVRCAQKLWDLGSRNDVKILKGGYEKFSAVYPFLRTKQIIYLQPDLDELQTYPIEVIPQLLYTGKVKHGTCPYIQRDLKIKAHVSCSSYPSTFYRAKGDDLYQMKNEDESDTDLLSHLPDICRFIDRHRLQREAVLVYSDLGVGRSISVIIAYLIYTRHYTTYQDAYRFIQGFCPSACPNESFKRQLINWEKSPIANDIKDNIRELSHTTNDNSIYTQEASLPTNKSTDSILLKSVVTNGSTEDDHASPSINHSNEYAIHEFMRGTSSDEGSYMEAHDVAGDRMPMQDQPSSLPPISIMPQKIPHVTYEDDTADKEDTLVE